MANYREREVPVPTRELDQREATPQVKLRHDLAYAVDKAMSRLAPHEAHIIQMVVDERLTFVLIGRTLGITAQSAHTRYKKAKEKLKVELLENETIREMLE